MPSWQRVDDVVVRAPAGHEVTFPLPRGRGTYAAVARRADLDAALVDVAREAGVTVLEGHACTAAAEHGDGVVVGVEGLGEIEARSRSPRTACGRRCAGTSAWPRPATGASGTPSASTSPGVGPAARDLFVWFEPDLLPGYAWSFPLPGRRANVGFGIQRGGKVARVQDMAGIWPSCSTGRTSAAVLGEGAEPESPPPGVAHPRPVDDVVLTGGGRCSWATRPPPPTR